MGVWTVRKIDIIRELCTSYLYPEIKIFCSTKRPYPSGIHYGRSIFHSINTLVSESDGSVKFCRIFPLVGSGVWWLFTVVHRTVG